MKRIYITSLTLFLVFLLSCSTGRKSSGPFTSRGYSEIATGISFYQEGDFDRALECFEEALRVFEMIADEKGEAIAKYHIGLVYLRRNNKKALHYLEESYNVLKTEKNWEQPAAEALSMAYIKFSNLKEAKKLSSKIKNEASRLLLKALITEKQGLDATPYYEEALKKCKRKELKADILSNYGKYLLKIGKREDAAKKFKEALKIDSELQLPYEVAMDYMNLYKATKNKNYLKKSKRILEELGLDHESSTGGKNSNP